jgi:hypothetical protein
MQSQKHVRNSFIKEATGTGITISLRRILKTCKGYEVGIFY